ncbi:MAG: hypothetical protein NXI04_04650 [Planctomycetaceae bacterium]|nr:hypothetical protein [Planctomycetaceae bacterium]
MSSSSTHARKMFWARIVAVAILLLVAVAKPRVEAWLGLDSPTAPAATSESESPSKSNEGLIDPDEFIAAGPAEGAAEGPAESEPERPTTQSGKVESRVQPGSSRKASDDVAKQNPDKAGASEPVVGRSIGNRTDGIRPANDKPIPGKLKLVDKARQKFQSTAGLLYVQGSADGHRLKHVLKHAQDIPEKNIHGVFDGEGDRDQILAWIDIAYEAGRKGGRGTKVERQGGRVVYTVRMSQRIGYVGGRAGKRDNYPECRYLRLVVQNDNEVVTAYPSRSM